MRRREFLQSAAGAAVPSWQSPLCCARTRLRLQHLHAILSAILARSSVPWIAGHTGNTRRKLAPAIW